MTDPSTEKTQRLKTSDTPSGGSETVVEHPPSNENGGPETADRGRQRSPNQTDGNVSGGGITTDKLWQMQDGRREVCPVFVAGNALPKCPASVQPCQEPGADAAGEGGLVAHGNSGDGPVEENLSQLQGESGKHIKRTNSGGVGADARQGKNKHRRRRSKKKRRWKPYFKLSWEEKKELDERETARASRLREEMFAKGMPVAPYNTTQFLMDEHDREEPDLNTEAGARRLLGPGRPEDTASEEDDNEDEEDDGSGGGSDGIGRPGNAGGEFLQRDFSETYEKYHVESLQNMTKQELVQEYLELEKCMSRLEEENNKLRCAANQPGTPLDSPPPQNHAEPTRLKVLETELERLKAQNSELLQQNQLLKEQGQIVSP